MPYKLNNMYIIITPITNPIGYANKFREEACANNQSDDKKANININNN